MKPTENGLWELKNHSRWKLPYPLYSMDAELMFHLASEVTTPLMRVRCSDQPVWKPEISLPAKNEEFFQKLKKNSSYCEEHTIEGTHLLPITSPTELGGLIGSFIENIESRI